MRTGSTFRHSQKPPPLIVGAVLALISLAAASARADVIRTPTSVTFTGGLVTSTTGEVTVAATLSYDPNNDDFLNLLLVNTSTSPTIASAGLLTSFYFGVYSGTTNGTFPTLQYVSGSGQVYQPIKNGPDIPGVWHPPATAGGTGTFAPYATGLSDLKATKTGDWTWQFKNGFSLPASSTLLNFGIGTAGNATLAPNNFNGNIVDGNDFGISVGDATTQNVESVKYVVSGSALFQFKGFHGYTINNIPNDAVFGLGTNPDLIITVPEPAGIALAAIGAMGVLGLRCRRRHAWVGKLLRSTAAAVAAGVVIVAILFAVPARAAPDAVPVADWDFSTGTSGLGWTSQTFKTGWIAVSGTRYDYWKPPTGSAPYWHVNVKGPTPELGEWFVNALTSPVITVPQKVDTLDFIIRQRFSFPKNITTLNPIVTGQVAWRFYDPAHLDAAFQPFAPATFATGTVPPPYSAISPDPNWVPNNYTVGAYGVPPLLTGGGAWIGSSPGWATRDFVMSEVFLDGLKAGQQVQFRFMNAILDVGCTGSEWDVARVTVVGQMPEPGGIALAMIGAGSAAFGLAIRGRRRLTNGPRDRA